MDCRQNRRERIYIKEEQGIMPEAIKHYCDHVFQHWRLQGLVDSQTEQKREDRHRRKTGITPEAIKHYCEHVFQP